MQKKTSNCTFSGWSIWHVNYIYNKALKKWFTVGVIEAQCVTGWCYRQGNIGSEKWSDLPKVNSCEEAESGFQGRSVDPRSHEVTLCSAVPQPSALAVSFSSVCCLGKGGDRQETFTAGSWSEHHFTVCLGKRVKRVDLTGREVTVLSTGRGCARPAWTRGRAPQ